VYMRKATRGGFQQAREPPSSLRFPVAAAAATKHFWFD